MGFVETVAATVGAALIIGLTVMAVKQPRQYQRLAPYLALLLLIIFVLTVAYGFGAQATEAALDPFIDGHLRLAALNAARVVQPNMGLVIICVAGSALFFTALRELPKILGIGEDGDDQNNGEDKP